MKIPGHLLICVLAIALALTACSDNTNRESTNPTSEATNIISHAAPVTSEPSLAAEELTLATKSGSELFIDHACWRCHSVGDMELPGQQDFINLGPDLAGIGSRLNHQQLIESITSPSARIAGDDLNFTDGNGNSLMPPFADVLTQDAINHIAHYLASLKNEHGHPTGTYQVTNDNFNSLVLESDKLVLLDFWAEWCLPCLEIEPILEELAGTYADSISICKIEVDTNPELVTEYVPDNIFPCLILIKDGKIVERRYGTDPEMEIKPFFIQWFNSHLEK